MTLYSITYMLRPDKISKAINTIKKIDKSTNACDKHIRYGHYYTNYDHYYGVSNTVCLLSLHIMHRTSQRPNINNDDNNNNNNNMAIIMLVIIINNN